MNWFTKRREELKMTQRQIALALNMTTSAVSAWENDQASPRLALADQLATLYDVKQEEIIRQIVALAKRVRAASIISTSPKKKLVGAK